VRLDRLLVQRTLFESREKARRAILAGLVRVAGIPVSRPGEKVAAEALVVVEASAEPYVSRGGRKLEAALDRFPVDPRGRVCLDVGASTGGFTDCLLSRGASRVYAVDVGHGQLVPKLAADPRVISFEGVNARELPVDFLPQPCSLIVVDLSFISILKVLPALLPHLEAGGWLLPLIKPQFEIGPQGVGKKGVVRDAERRQGVIEERLRDIAAMGLTLRDWHLCPVPGMNGNREAFAAFQRGEGR
jgi:23S rRNA (cytidine1920-2'-O)/16S rRNA (cytidine1409-2'-O)-methyltransferase